MRLPVELGQLLVVDRIEREERGHRFGGLHRSTHRAHVQRVDLLLREIAGERPCLRVAEFGELGIGSGALLALDADGQRVADQQELHVVRNVDRRRA